MMRFTTERKQSEHFVTDIKYLGARGGAFGRKAAGSIPDGVTGIFY
jgi:hypothetical protein